MPAGNKVDFKFTQENGEVKTTSINVMNGESPYEIWLRLGNTGTEADFIASLKGPAGNASAGIQDVTMTVTPVANTTPAQPAAIPPAPIPAE